MRAFIICAAAMAALVTATPGAVMASESRTPGVLARLDRARVHDRAALRRAGSPVAQARVADRLARAHLAAAAALRPGAGNATLIADLSGAGRAYQALAHAATGASPARYAAAADAVRRADAQLAAAVARPAAPVQRPASRGPALPVLVVLLVAAAGAAGALVRRRRRSAPHPRPAEGPARGPWRPRTCLTPLHPPAPAPTPPARTGSDPSRRWDGAARSASALEPGHLPRHAAVAERRAQAASLEHVQHRLRRAGERAGLPSHEPEREVLRAHERA
jgi:hypothetical protein